ncbi:hypothetical protein BHE74_00015248 [Ensete ventricosum]|nr:hypothetical protein BHE74_00015248 [Ensete ventricosum]RZR94078.1 hypothetical protein BHM03_00022698 [Ensete ventricosum]
MFRLGVTREWVDEGQLPKERTQSEVAEALRCVDKGHTWRDRMSKQAVERGEEATMSPEGLSYPKSKASVKKEVDSEECPVSQKRIYRSRRKRLKCKATDCRAMGLAAPWYCRGGTFVESSIPCSHGRALVVKGAEEVANAKANSKY